jgi:hypothetical protein
MISRRFCTDSKSEKLNPLLLSGHSTVQALSIRMTRTFRSNLPLCQETSNCSSLHPSGRLYGCLSNTSGRRLVFDQLWDFFPKHRYVKTNAIVRTMCVPVRTLSFIRQVMHSKFNRSDIILHGPDAQASYMEIACIN